VRGLLHKYPGEEALVENIPSISAEYLYSFGQYLKRKTDAEILMLNLFDLMDSLNKKQDTRKLEHDISLRAAALGNPGISGNVEEIKKILSSFELSSDLEESLEKAKKRLEEMAAKDMCASPGYYSGLFREIERSHLAIERNRRLKDIAAGLFDYFREFNLSFHIELDERSALISSLGAIEKLALFDYGGKEHELLYVNQIKSTIEDKFDAFVAAQNRETPASLCLSTGF
jgi:hypothetical protein